MTSAELPLLAGAAAFALLIGISVGATGIGGILLVPFLRLALGIPVKQAIAVALISYLPAGGVAVFLYARRGSIPWREAGWLCAAAVPLAYLGARAAAFAPATLLEALIGALLFTGGVHALRRSERPTKEFRRLSPPALGGLGAATAFVSALTGAGGAFVLLPVLLLLEAPVLGAIGLGQAIQMPIAAVASVSNLQNGLIDPSLAATLAPSLALGICIGTPIAHALPQQRLRRLLGAIIAGAGTLMLLRTAVIVALGIA